MIIVFIFMMVVVIVMMIIIRQDDVNEYDGDHVIMPEEGYGGLLKKLAEGLRVCFKYLPY